MATVVMFFGCHYEHVHSVVHGDSTVAVIQEALVKFQARATYDFDYLNERPVFLASWVVKALYASHAHFC